jgi:hypothetical protein
MMGGGGIIKTDNKKDFMDAAAPLGGGAVGLRVW